MSEDRHANPPPAEPGDSEAAAGTTRFITRCLLAATSERRYAALLPENSRDLLERLLRAAGDEGFVRRAKSRVFRAVFRALVGFVLPGILPHYLARKRCLEDWVRRAWLGAACPGSEMITELYMPRPALARFLARAAETLRAHDAKVIYGTVRLIERDEVSFLAWATEPFACVIFSLHVDHKPAAVERAAEAFRALIDVASSFGGSYYLTYHRWAMRAQIDACHPRFAEFLARQRTFDPDARWQSEWLRHHQRLYASG